MAGGAHLKKLKESLQNAGFTGQSNFSKKHKGKKKGGQDKLSKEERQRVLNDIREQFNPFDVKVTRNKRADAMQKKITVGKPGINKQAGEEARRSEYEERMKRKNKAGGIIDRRFGEGNSKLTPEEKMLERFTKERLSKANKSSMYNLDDDNNIDFDEDEDDKIGGLTHLGQSLSGKTSTKDSIDDDDFFAKKRQNDDQADEQPLRKKTKAEVMKEVIAKAKKYKHERQQKHLENMEMVDELDDDFENVMDEISVSNKNKEIEDDTKSKFDLDYEMKVTEAKLDKRAKPTDRTKTEEELKKEEEEKRADYEKKRLERMEGEDEDEQFITDGVTGDDLGDDFWNGSGDEETGFSVGSPVPSISSDEEIQEDNEESDKKRNNDKNENESKPTTITIGNKTIVVKSKKSNAKLPCPQTLSEFKKHINESDYEETVSTIKKVFELYQPKLAEGNKEKLGIFTTVLFEYLLELSNKTIGSENKGYVRIMDFLSRTICNLTEKYENLLLDSYRKHITEAHERLLLQDPAKFPLQSDSILLTLAGRSFSTSDKFHLVVIPALLIACEALEFMKLDDNKTNMFFGLYVCDLLIQYERISERMIPEVISFIHRLLLITIPQPEEIEDWEKILVCSIKPTSTKFTMKSPCHLPNEIEKLSISKMWELSKSTNSKDQDKFIELITIKTIKTLDSLISKMIKNSIAAPELTTSFIPILRHLIKNNEETNTLIINIASKFSNINKISIKDRKPLKLQKHRAIGIQQVAPRFNEHFNPDRKFNRSIDMDPMDPIAVRDEISKLKHQVKEERKQALKELRRDTKFEARAQISRKKKEYDEYHSKMAKIYNSIQTEEGTAKNEYEREKKARKNKK